MATGSIHRSLTAIQPGPKKHRRRKFHPRTYAAIVERQNGICACGCGEPLGTDRRDMHFDHEIALWNGGEDSPDNLRALKKKHHLLKTIREATDRAKMKRIIDRDGLRKRRENRQDRMFARYLEAAE